MTVRTPPRRPAGSLRHSLAWISMPLFALIVAALAAVPWRLPKPSAREIREQLRAELRPIALSNCTMERFGSANDGGYLMCGNLLGNVQSAYSYGIGPQDAWGCDVSETLDVPVHQYDCFSPPEGPCPNGRSTFHDECVGPKTSTVDGRAFDTLARHIVRNGDAGRTLVMKIDIEGAELDSVLQTSDRLFARVDQLAMEIHGTNERFLKMVRKLKRTFHVAHLHFNNQACLPVSARPFPAWAFQVLFVNKRVGVADPARPSPMLPHPLDAPDWPVGRDCQTIEETDSNEIY